ncbi:phosphoenolpyruvate synthase [Patescibacteria group bacterium]|nr:MAG: phosphoenolpyruvate synthase [Patescibacteria group bacterium]
MYIRWFKELGIKDIPSVGGKTASLGEMYNNLTANGVAVPNGFALTADAYRLFLREDKLDKKIKEILNKTDGKNVKSLAAAGAKIRQMVLSAEFPGIIADELKAAYKELGKSSVAVRSSATAEDLPDASFAGQQETYLNVVGADELILACQKCIASLFTDRAISYRVDKGFDHAAVALSVCVQEMVRSDLGASGVMFTLDTESGFKGVVLINAAYGLGEYVVKGRVIPDQFFVFKDGVRRGLKSIISKRLGSKEVKLVYGKTGTRQETVKMPDQHRFCVSPDEVLQLAKWGMQIEEHYQRPMDIEWAKDGRSGKLYIVQARSETVRSRDNINVIEQYHLKQKGKVLVEGISIGQKIGQGKARVINSPRQMKSFRPGEVLITRITDPDWEPIMRIASAIVTEQGGKTSHAAIVSRELGTPCLVGAARARQIVKPGQEVTVSCAEGEAGYVYKGRLPFEIEKQEIKAIAKTRTKIMMNVGDPGSAFALSHIPSDGVGLAREEFIFTNFIKIHPLALVNYKKLADRELKAKIDELTIGYKDKARYCVDKLAEGIAFIAAAYYPRDVIVRLSDFKTNEYATLIGGHLYEPKEENPMLGWRGASRYYDPAYKPGFRLECAALKMAREEWGLKNIIVMVPFCRTVAEGKKVLAVMKEFGLERGSSSPLYKGRVSEGSGLKVYVMCEIPSNVILAKEYSQIFDGFSIGSNDLTQLTLGVDRDSALVSHVYDERNEAVKTLIRQVISTAHKYGRKVGICGQAPSDYPEFADFLVQEGIDSISLNPDTVLKARERVAGLEKKVSAKKGAIIKIAAATKLLLIFGVVGLLSTLGGYACQPNNQIVNENVKKAIVEETGKLKTQLEQLAAEIRKRESEQPKSLYSEDSFARFTLQYPAAWTVEHGDKVVRFQSADKLSRFIIASAVIPRSPEATGGSLSGSSTTTVWQNIPAKIYTRADGTKLMELYPQGFKKSKNIIEISGDKKTFDEMLGWFTLFSVK